MSLRLTTLGRPSVTLGKTELTSLPGKPVAFGVLVYLALEREATRDRLVSVFWPDSSQEKARHALSQTLYELRQVLGEEWATSSGNSVGVDDSVWVDGLAFANLAESGQNAQAVDLYQGPFLGGVYLAQTHPFEDWVERTRSRLARRFRAAVNALICECRDRGDCESALRSAWKWVGLDPLDDGAQQHLIRLLAETGSRAESLAQFDRYTKLLDSELGLEPLDEMVELVEAIRSGPVQPPPAVARQDGPVGSAPDVGTPEAPENRKPADPPAWPLPVPSGMDARPSLRPGADLREIQDQINAELPSGLEILRPIGEGSMALVFLGRQPHLRRLVAVKVLSPRHYHSQKARKRFEREAQAAARIQHPNVCTVHDVGSLKDGTPFLISPFIKGTSLAQRLKGEGRLGAAEVRKVLRELASALAAAHGLGIIHRDVRPANVLREDDSGRHYLCDFGLAGVLETGDVSEPRITATGELLGHPAYISPEHMEGKPLTDRTDIYSLGVMAYELLTGRTPLGTENRPKSRKAPTVAVEIEPLVEFMAGTDPALAELVGHCLAREPSHRPTAAEVERKLSSGKTARAQEEAAPFSDVSLLRLLLRKRLPHFLGVYVASAWLAVESVGFFQQRGSAPAGLFRATVVSVPFGFIAVSILGWFHGEKGPQTMPRVERWLLWALGVGWVAACIWVELAWP